jgi:hypothetical protein
MNKLQKWLAGVSLTLGLVGASNAAVIYAENFDSGAAAGYTMDGLWHVTSNFPASGNFALGFVRNETPGAVPNGDFDTGDINASAQSALITLPTGTIVLTFKAFVGDEHDVAPDEFDRLSVKINGAAIASSPPSDGGVVIPDWGGIAAYNLITVDLSSYAGQTIQLEFNFDTLDEVANAYPGVRIDDICIATGGSSCTAAAVPEPASLALLGLGLVGFGWARRKRAV